MFKAVVVEREVMFSWSPPIGQKDEIIISYNLSCTPPPSSTIHQQFSSPLTVTGFTPNTLYSCSVVASNDLVSGPPSTVSFTTQQDCK